ncbi:MAG: kelch repeat-containing protein [Solirubrobacteraceae bacterium]
MRGRSGVVRRALGVGAAIGAALLLAGSAGAATETQWTVVGSLAAGRAFDAAGLLASGKVIVAGGFGSSGVLDSSEIFDPSSDTWSAGPAMITPRDSAASATLANGDLFIAGGDATGVGSDALPTAEVYDQATNAFTAVSNPMGSSRSSAAAALMGDGNVLVVGGEGATTLALATTDIYDPATNAFLTGAAAPPAMSTGRYLPAAATLADGDVLVAGGLDATGTPLANAEVYDPATNAWTPVSNPMSSPRLYASMVPLPGGRELVAGGIVNAQQQSTASTDIYDPATNSFTPGPAMPIARALFGMVALPDGKILAAGGYPFAGGVLAESDLFDPATGSWSQTGDLPGGGAAGFATVELPDGQVLEAGGASPDQIGNTSQASLYTPPAPPAAPTAVAAAAGNASALVTFAPPADTGGEPVTGYTVTASTGQAVTTPDGRTFATVGGLANGTQVTFTVTATNAEGTSLASAPSAAVTPSAPAGPPATTTVTVTTTTVAPAPLVDIAPTLRISGLAAKLTLARFLKGVRFSVTPSKAVALQVSLLATVRQATIASADNLTLADSTLAGSAARRTITLVPARRLVGRPRAVKVKLVIVATDAAGTRTTITRTLTVTATPARSKKVRHPS